MLVAISPNEPVSLPLYSEPSESQLSSISQRLYFFAIFKVLSTSKGLPNVCAKKIAFVHYPEKGKKLAERIAELGQGRLYRVKERDDIDYVVLEDYYSVI